MTKPIPDDISIKEQYSDILEIVDRLLPIIGDVVLDNHQPLGRLRGALMFLKQEVESERLPLPGTRDMVSTISHLAGNPMFPEEFPDITQDLYGIITLVTCEGFIKPRHYPRLLELIEQLNLGIEKLQKDKIELIPEERMHFVEFQKEIKNLGKNIYQNKVVLPLSKTLWPTYWDKKKRSRVWDLSDTYYDLERILNGPLTSCWRPRQSQPTTGWVVPDWVKEPIDPLIEKPN